MAVRRARETQNQFQVDEYRRRGPVQFGPWTSYMWRSDPRHLGFMLARYKFCAKILAGSRRVLEIGCGDGAGIPVMLQATGSVCGIDFEPLVLEDAARHLRRSGFSGFRFLTHDITQGPVPGGPYDAAYSLDVIEHVPARREGRFVANVARSLGPRGVCILGTPNKLSERYGSPTSKVGHVNLKTAETLRTLLARAFHNVFIFSMNDEVVHTGYYPMAHYLLGLGVGVRRPATRRGRRAGG